MNPSILKLRKVSNASDVRKFRSTVVHAFALSILVLSCPSRTRLVLYILFVLFFSFSRISEKQHKFHVCTSSRSTVINSSRSDFLKFSKATAVGRSPRPDSSKFATCKYYICKPTKFVIRHIKVHVLATTTLVDFILRWHYMYLQVHRSTMVILRAWSSTSSTCKYNSMYLPS